MKDFNKKLIIAALVVCPVMFLAGANAVSAATSPTLSALTGYSILGASTVTCTGATTVAGDVGVSAGTAITGFPVPCVAAATHSNDASAIAAQVENLSEFTTLDQGCDHSYADGQDLTLLSPLGPGVYCSAGSFALSGNLNLTGSGVWIFKTASTLITSPNSSITGGDSCNIWWRIGSSATIGTNTIFKGNIFALTSVTLDSGATLDGRALAQTGAVTLDGNTVTGPTCAVPVNGTCGTAAKSYLYTDSAFSGTMCTLGSGVTTPASPTFPSAGSSVTWTCAGSDGGSSSGTCTASVASVPDTTLTVVKVVVNDSGRIQSVSDFPLFINGTSVVSGIPKVLAAPATYTVTETADARYSQSFSANCPGGIITLAVGETKTCTITNDDIVASGGGGTNYIPTVVPPLIAVVKVPSPLALPAGPGLVTYDYTLRNIGTVPVTDITMVDDTCSPVTFVSGDSNSDAKLDMEETWKYNCSSTLSETHTNTVVATGWANGVSATDIASATVVVGIPIVPPLIHVTKIPNPLTLPAGGGMITYTNKVTNPGTVALSNVRIADDKCSPVNYISGDANNDSKLDTTETWVYTCQMNLTKTTTNTVTASGEANGLTARDFAIATVTVPFTPGLPNTGFAPGQKNNALWIAAIFFGALILASVPLIVAIKKRKI